MKHGKNNHSMHNRDFLFIIVALTYERYIFIFEKYKYVLVVDWSSTSWPCVHFRVYFPIFFLRLVIIEKVTFYSYKWWTILHKWDEFFNRKLFFPCAVLLSVWTTGQQLKYFSLNKHSEHYLTIIIFNVIYNW